MLVATTILQGRIKAAAQYKTSSSCDMSRGDTPWYTARLRRITAGGVDAATTAVSSMSGSLVVPVARSTSHTRERNTADDAHGMTTSCNGTSLAKNATDRRDG